MADPRRAALEAAIEADLDDERAYAVYADYLQELGDPHGEMVAMSIAAVRDPALEGEVRAARQANQAVFVPSVAGHIPFVTWHYGFVARAVIEGPIDVDELLRHPSMRFVRELAIRRTDLADVIRTIARHPRPTIRELDLGLASYDERPTTLIDLGELWEAVPRLHKITLRNLDVVVGEEVPLTALDVDATSVCYETLATLSRASWPNLARLNLTFQGHGATRRPAVVGLRALLAAPLPALRHLAIHNFLDGREPDALAVFKLAVFERLETLDLSQNLLNDASARLLANQGAFAGLQWLDVSRNWLTPVGIARLQSLVGVVIAEKQSAYAEREEP